MSKKVITYTDPYKGQIELTKIGEVFCTGTLVTTNYYIVTDERYVNRGLQNGVYFRDGEGDMKYLRGEEMSLITRIYDKLTRID